MKKTSEKIYEILTKLEKESIIDTETALAVFQSMLKEVDADEVGSIFALSNIKSAFDKKVDGITSKLEERHNAELSNRDSRIGELEQLIPKESDPEKIKQKLELATDPSERRLLQFEYNNAVMSQKLAKIEAEKLEIEQREQQTALKNRLAEIAKNDGLTVHDPFMFASFGERAEDMMREYSEKNNAYIEEQVNKMASDRFAGTKQSGGDKATPKMTLDEIEQIQDRGERLKAMEKIGY